MKPKPAINLLASAGFALFATAIYGGPLHAADATRGQQLYQNQCTTCHESLVHVRRDRRAKDLAAVRTQIVRWSSTMGLQWKDEEIDDVLAFLNARYYGYPQ